MACRDITVEAHLDSTVFTFTAIRFQRHSIASKSSPPASHYVLINPRHAIDTSLQNLALIEMQSIFRMLIHQTIVITFFFLRLLKGTLLSPESLWNYQYRVWFAFFWNVQVSCHNFWAHIPESQSSWSFNFLEFLRSKMFLFSPLGSNDEELGMHNLPAYYAHDFWWSMGSNFNFEFLFFANRWSAWNINPWIFQHP